MLGLDGHGCAKEPRRDGRGISIKADGNIGMDLGVGRITTSRSERWEGAHGLGIKTLAGWLASGGVDADIGHLVAPLVGLGLEVGEIAAGAQRPKVVPAGVDGAWLHLPLFLRWGHIAGDGGDMEGPQKRQKVCVETHQGALPLQDRRAHVVMDECFGGALEKVQGMEEAAVQGVLPLRRGKLQVQQPAMTCNHGETGECARRGAIGERAERAPVALALLARGGCEADDGLWLCGRATHAAHIIPHNGHPPSAALSCETLVDDRGRHLGSDGQETGELVLERLELTGPGTSGPRWSGVGEICAGRLSPQAQGLSELPYREALMGQAVDRENGALVNQGRLPESCG